MGFEHDSFCEGCKISTSRKANKGKTSTGEAMQVTGPGQAVTMDVIPNNSHPDYISVSHFQYYLLICDVYSKYCMLLGMVKSKTINVIEAIDSWIATNQLNPTFHPGALTAIRTDAGSCFTSQEFIKECESRHIKLSHAARATKK